MTSCIPVHVSSIVYFKQLKWLSEFEYNCHQATSCCSETSTLTVRREVTHQVCVTCLFRVRRPVCVKQGSSHPGHP